MTSVAAIVCAHSTERWETITEALASLRSQTRLPDEIILSVDGNVELFDRAVEAFGSNTTVVFNSGPSGVSPTRNVAAKQTSHEVLAYLDDDATADTEWIASLMRWYDDPSVVGVGGAANPNWIGTAPGWFPPSFHWVIGCSHSGIEASPGPIRNFIGCNMSVRRTAWEAVGGFSSELGRVGSNGGGGDETDFCIRIADELGGSIIHDPAAIVDHQVPKNRQTLRYFTMRCFQEGISKSHISQRAGSTNVLGDERKHLLSTLPREFLGGIVQTVKGDRYGMARSAAIVLGTAATVLGFFRKQKPTVAENDQADTSFVPAQVVTLDVAEPIDLTDADPEKRLFALVRSGQTVLGAVHYDVNPTEAEVARQLPRRSELVPANAESTNAVSMNSGSINTRTAIAPTVAVVIATRDRTDSLRRCLDSIEVSRTMPDQLVVVDSAPADDETKQMIAARNETESSARVTYVRSTRPGLAVAHNVALAVVRTDIVAITDDDVLIDRYWIDQILDGFAHHADIVCVTGAIMPAELETWPQQWVESTGGLNKGFERRVFDSSQDRPDDPLFPFSAGSMGSGANMAFSASWLRSQGGFLAQLGAGTTAKGGDDLRAFYDVIASGKKLLFNPSAVVFHHHHRTVEAIERQSYGYGAGLTAFLASLVHQRPAVMLQMLKNGRRAMRHAASVSNPASAVDFPGQQKRARLQRMGMVSGPVRYIWSTLRN